MLKMISQLECKIEEKNYRFLCDCDSPITHVREVLTQFLHLVDQIEEKAKLEQQALAVQSQVAEVKPQE